nr:hypothetical protein [Candidatus Woesearchaeota archaeon]
MNNYNNHSMEYMNSGYNLEGIISNYTSPRKEHENHNFQVPGCPYCRI